MKTLLIDDIRDIKADVVARTFIEGIRALKENSIFDVLYLDHDLGEDEYWVWIEGQSYPKTGYGIMCYLENNLDLRPGKVVIVSANPVGRKNMQAVIEKIYIGRL